MPAGHWLAASRRARRSEPCDSCCSRLRARHRRSDHAARRRSHQRRSPAAAAHPSRRALPRACLRSLRRSVGSACRRIVIGVPLGLAAGGSVATAALAAAAGALLIVTLVGIALAVSSVVHLIVRDRRRGELLTLIVVIVLPMLGLLPGLLGQPPARHGRPDADASGRAPHQRHRAPGVRGRAVRALRPRRAQRAAIPASRH